jgi:hypothetical protein
MRSTGVRVELDPADRANREAAGATTTRLARTTPALESVRAVRATRSPKLHALLLATLIAIGPTLALAAYGVETDQKSIAIVGLAATTLVAVTASAGARRSIRTEERSSEALVQALADSERARNELHLANERLQRKNAELEALELAVREAFEWIDEQTQGRLRELVEEAGEDLAALVDDALDEPGEEAS